MTDTDSVGTSDDDPDVTPLLAPADGLPAVAIYASGGYPYPGNDLARLKEELRRFRDSG